MRCYDTVFNFLQNAVNENCSLIVKGKTVISDTQMDIFPGFNSIFSSAEKLQLKHEFLQDQLNSLPKCIKKETTCGFPLWNSPYQYIHPSQQNSTSESGTPRSSSDIASTPQVLYSQPAWHHQGCRPPSPHCTENQLPDGGSYNTY